MSDPQLFQSLQQGHCVPCEGGTAPLTTDEENKYYDATPSWELDRAQEPHALRKNFKFKTFMDAISFVNKVAALADKQGHHPDIYIFYNQVKLELSTHAIKGLSENDFIMAVQIDELQ